MSKSHMFNPPDEDEKILYRPQIFNFKYRTCLEKPRGLERYDPDTLKSLSTLMQSQKIPSVTKRYETSLTEKEPSPQVAQSQQICPQWLKFDKVCPIFKSLQSIGHFLGTSNSTLLLLIKLP